MIEPRPERLAEPALVVVAGLDADRRRVEADEQEPIAERRQVGQRLDLAAVDLDRRPVRPGSGGSRRSGRRVVLRVVGHGSAQPRPREPVAEPVLGRDVRLARRDRVELHPEVADRHPEEVDVGVVAGAPDRGEDLAMGDELAGMLDEVGEQPELGRGEADVLAAQPGPVVVEVDDEVAVLEAAGPFGRRRRGPTERRLDPGEELREATAAW